MSDTDYMLDAVNAYWDDVLYAYAQHAARRPIVLLDLQESRIYLYPYEGFKSELSPRSQASLADKYKRSIRDKQIVVFVAKTNDAGWCHSRCRRRRILERKGVMLLTVEGKYKNGKIDLLEAPPGVGEARVIVTFLPAAAQPQEADIRGMMRLGQFAGPNLSTEEDFKAVEWRGGEEPGEEPGED